MDYCRRVRDRVRQITKIPTCIGIGPTKTLAKLANKHAKSGLTGVSDFSDLDARRQAFAEMPIGEIWGVGGASQSKLIRSLERSMVASASRKRLRAASPSSEVRISSSTMASGVVTTPR